MPLPISTDCMRAARRRLSFGWGVKSLGRSVAHFSICRSVSAGTAVLALQSETRDGALTCPFHAGPRLTLRARGLMSLARVWASERRLATAARLVLEYSSGVFSPAERRPPQNTVHH